MKSEEAGYIWQANSSGEYIFNSSEHSNSHVYLLPLVKKLLNDIKPGSFVLDLGCGNGSLIAACRDLGWNLYGVDQSTSGIAQARQAYPFVSFSTGDIAAADFSHPLVGRCDAVISTEVVEHVMLPRFLAKNAFRLLRPGGSLVITTPYHGYLKNLILALTGQLDAHFHALWDFGHIKFWSRKTLTCLLYEAGFEEVVFSGAGRLPYVWKSMVICCRRPCSPDSTANYYTGVQVADDESIAGTDK